MHFIWKPRLNKQAKSPDAARTPAAHTRAAWVQDLRRRQATPSPSDPGQVTSPCASVFTSDRSHNTSTVLGRGFMNQHVQSA